MVETIKEDPFIPIAWQKNHSGMQGSEYLTSDFELNEAKATWLIARDKAVHEAKNLNKIGATKQLCNRLLEPFMWTTMLITGPKSGWENFFELRNPQYNITITSPEDLKGKVISFKSKKEFIKFGNNLELTKNWTELDWFKANKGQAEIHMMTLAESIYDAYNESTPKKLQVGEWHIPFGDKIGNFVNIPLYQEISNKEIEDNVILNKVKISVAMAARTSYTIVGEEKGLDYEALIGLHDRLLAQDPPHSSPLEHCARAMSNEEHNSYLKGVIELIDIDEPEYNGGIYEPKFSEKGWCNNFKGFIPYRYLVDNKISI